MSRRRKLLLAFGVLAAALGVFVVVWFQPQKLFIDQTVDEDLPAEMQMAMAKEPAPSAGPSGPFRSLEHSASGRAKILSSDGQTLLRFEDFRVENGPDLFVYLSAGDIDGPGRALGEDFVDLGPLKGNIGDQNYVIPEGTDLEKYRTAVVWCRRFTVAFAAAELT